MPEGIDSGSDEHVLDDIELEHDPQKSPTAAMESRPAQSDDDISLLEKIANAQKSVDRLYRLGHWTLLQDIAKEALVNIDALTTEDRRMKDIQILTAYFKFMALRFACLSMMWPHKDKPKLEITKTNAEAWPIVEPFVDVLGRTNADIHACVGDAGNPEVIPIIRLFCKLVQPADQK